MGESKEGKELPQLKSRNSFPTLDGTHCPHIANVKASHIEAKLFNPTLWSCDVCGTTESVLACLTCGHFGCMGEEGEGHAAVHARQEKHPLVMEVNREEYHCFICNGTVQNDNQKGDLKRILNRVRMLSSNMVDPLLTQSIHAIYSKQWEEERELQATVPKKFDDYEEKDLMYTALQHWRLSMLSRSWNQWRDYTKRWKENDAKEKSKEEATGDSANGKGGTLKRKERGEEEKELAEKFPPPKKAATNSNEEAEERTMEAEVMAQTNGKGSGNAPATNGRSKVLRAHGQTGLRNLGNTCYLNSVLQALSGTDRFRGYFVEADVRRELEEDESDEEGDADNRPPLWRRATVDCMKLATTKVRKNEENDHEDARSLAIQLHRLMRVLWSGKWAVITPYAFLRSVWAQMSQFRNYQQQDAQEFLCLLLDRLSVELRTSPLPLQPKPPSSKPPPSEFTGQQENVVECTRCKHRSVSRTPFSDVSLDIPGGEKGSSSRSRGGGFLTLYDCIEHSFQPETINGYQCDGCNEYTDATKSIQFKSLPSILCFTLIRFSWKSDQKITTPVHFPVGDLDMSPYCATKASRTHYQLRSCVMHHGKTRKVGHYTAIAWNEDRSAWLHFNDSKVTVVDEQSLYSTGTPYLLIYERKGT